MPNQNDGNSPLKPIKWYKKLATAVGRLEEGMFLVEGERAVGQINQAAPGAVIEIVARDISVLAIPGYPVRLVTERQFQSISNTKTPQGIMAVVDYPRETYSAELSENPGDKVLLLEDVQDPGNVGTLIRTAAAFGFAGVILSDKCADPFSPKCVQAAAGAVLSLWLRRTPEYLGLVRALKESGHYIVAADLTGTADVSVLAGQEKMILALGNEASGLSQELLEVADYRLRIPVAAEKAQSLNVAACGAICMYLVAAP